MSEGGSLGEEEEAEEVEGNEDGEGEGEQGAGRVVQPRCPAPAPALCLWLLLQPSPTEDSKKGKRKGTWARSGFPSSEAGGWGGGWVRRTPSQMQMKYSSRLRKDWRVQ